MTRRRNRKIFLITLGIFLTFFAIISFYYLEKRLSYARLENYLQDHDITEDISFVCTNKTNIRPVKLPDSMNYVVCLPPWAISENKIELEFAHFQKAVIRENSFDRGEEISSFIEENTGEFIPMKLLGPNEEVLYDGFVGFFVLDDIPSVYITMSENAIDIVNSTKSGEDKPHVPVWIKVIDSKGDTDTIVDGKIFRRGNTTFDGYDPKPYNLNLETPKPILDMPAGRKWALKANAMDDTQIIRNELAFGLSRMADFKPCPETRYVNLYINGKYNGLYLLSQRIDAKELLGLGEDESLLELDRRYGENDAYFVCDDEGIVIHYPDPVSDEDIERISARYDEAKQVIRNGGAYEDYIDVESFVKMYVIQDFMVQADVAFSSLYFYLGKDNKFHAGPIWDFDESCGMTASRPYHEDLALRARLFEARKWDATFFRDLAHNQHFMQLVASYYLNVFYDDVHGYMEEEWAKSAEGISDSIYINHWTGGVGHTGNATLDSAEALGDWINRRAEYLKDYYGNMDKYVRITYHFAWGPLAAAVKEGEPTGFMPDNLHEGNDDAFWGEIIGFADAEGNMVDDSYTPYGDTDLYAIYSEYSYAWDEYEVPWNK